MASKSITNFQPYQENLQILLPFLVPVLTWKTQDLGILHRRRETRNKRIKKMRRKKGKNDNEIQEEEEVEEESIIFLCVPEWGPVSLLHKIWSRIVHLVRLLLLLLLFVILFNTRTEIFNLLMKY